MRLSIICGGPDGLAASYADGDGKVVHRVCINADYVWPLMVAEFSAAEKASYRFHIAKVVLHELIVGGRVCLFCSVGAGLTLWHVDSIPVAVSCWDSSSGLCVCSRELLIGVFVARCP